MIYLKDAESQHRLTLLVTELARQIDAALPSPRRARIGLEIVIEDHKVSILSEIVTRRQPLRGLTSTAPQEQT